MRQAAHDRREEKRLGRIGMTAAVALAGGIGGLFLKYFYPYPPEADKIANLFGATGWLLLFYGVMVLAIIIFRKSLAPTVNLIFLIFVIPACLFYIFMNNWPG